MKRTVKIAFFWAGIIVMNGLFLLLFLWSVIPFGGKTLPHILEQSWDVAFHYSALAVSLACGLLAVGAMSFTLLHPIGLNGKHEEVCQNENCKQ